MTTVDVPAISVCANEARTPKWSSSADATIESLRTAVLGSARPLHRLVRDAVADLGDRPRSGLTYGDEAELAPDLLRAIVRALGGSSAEIAADPRLRGVLCEWAAVFAPHLLPVLTGHLDLSVGAIAALGNGSTYQQELLADLDDVTAVGELLLTELGGTNGADQETTATWDRIRGGFWLRSPSVSSWKFMPNIADLRTRKTGVVTARLLVDGVDEGVLPFLLRFRSEHGLADGLHVIPLPDKAWAPMDHALIRFDSVFVPTDALLGGDWAIMGNDGLECAIAPRQRFHRAIATLGEGRLDLANAAAASLRAGLALTVNYATQRRPGGRTRMAEFGTVRRDLVSGLASAYATTVLGRRIQDIRVTTPAGDPMPGVWSMLAKPLLAYTAFEVLQSCRQRAGAQGSLRSNWIGDWIGNIDGVRTAEGESQLLWKQAGQLAVDITALRLPATPPRLPWYVRLLSDRELVIAAGLRRGDFAVAGNAVDHGTAAIELARATSERLAATAVFIASTTAADETARALLESAAAVFALERIDEHGLWFSAHRQMSARRAQSVYGELFRHRAHLGEHLSELVDGFDIPLGPFDAPMAAPDYLQWWQTWANWPSDPTLTTAAKASEVQP